jgi:tetratricopeptide (TPR) repeat protein
MTTSPDSALQLLRDSVRTSELSRRQYAEWCLLLTQAQDKNYVTHTSDSLIRIAVDYFEEHGPESRQMLSYYYIGRVSQDLQRAPAAADYYLKALEVGKNAGDYALLGRIHSNLGMLYTSQYVHESALFHMKQAESCFRQIDDTIYQSLTLRDIARTYALLKQPDSATTYYKQALSTTTHYDLPFILSELGDQYIEKGDNETAYNCLTKALNIMTKEVAVYTPIYLAMGKLFYKIGDQDSARYYLLKSMDNPQIETLTSSYYYLSILARENQQLEEYARLQGIYESLRDSIIEQTYTENMIKMQYWYDYRHVEKEATLYKLRDAKNQKSIFLLVMGIFILFVGSTGYLIYYRIRKRKQQAAIRDFFQHLREKKFSITQDQIIENEKRIQELTTEQNKFDNEFSWEIDMLNSINHFIRNTIQEKITNAALLRNEAIYIKLHGSPTSTMSELDYKDLKEAIDRFYPDFKLYFNSTKEFTAENIQTAYMIKAELKPGEIAILTSKNRNTASMRLKSLAKKVFGEKNMKASWNKDIVKYILDI